MKDVLAETEALVQVYSVPFDVLVSSVAEGPTDEVLLRNFYGMCIKERDLIVNHPLNHPAVF